MKSRNIFKWLALVAIFVFVTGCAPYAAPAVVTGDFEGPVIVDGKADVVQFTVQAHSTQTNAPFVIENSAGTDVYAVSVLGAVTGTGGLDVDTTGAVSLDADLASNFNVSGSLVDLSLQSEAGRLVLKGDEAAADGVYIDADDAVGTGATVATGSTAGLVLSGGPVSQQGTLTGNVVFDMRDYADTTDDDMAHASLTANCSGTGTGAEECDLAIATVRAGVASTALIIDADGEMTLLSENEFELVNAATGSVGLMFQDYIDTTDDDMDHASIVANCSNSGAGVEECDLAVATTRAGAVSTAINVDADAEMTFLSENQFELVNAATGSVDLVFQDFIDTTDDDMDHAVISANCSATGTGAEDCDLTVAVAEAGAAPEIRFNIDGDGGITVGSANNNTINLTTDSTGDAELVVPGESIATGEILNDTITFANISDSSAVDADTVFTQGDGIELELRPSHTTGDTEGLLINIDQVDDGAATDDVIALKIEGTSESGDAGDTFYLMSLIWEEGTANTINDAAIAIDNAETTTATMTDGIIVTSSGVDLGVTDALDVSAANILNAINIGDNDVVVGTTMGVKNSSTGSVILNFHDYADTTDDDMAHVSLTSNCTTATTTAEDCDFTVGVVEAGAAADTRFTIDADDGVDIGSATNANVTLVSGVDTLVHDGDLTLSSDATGGNLGAKSEYIGLPRISMFGVGTGTNPAAQTIALFDDDPNGEYAPVDASVVEALSTTVVKYGTNSYHAAWDAGAVATDGIVGTNAAAGAAYDDMESAGLLVRSDTAWASGDLTLVLTDDGGARTYDIPALTTVNTWVWLEVNIATGDLSAVSDVAILMSAQGETAALGAFNMYIDLLYVWDSDDEEALSLAIQQDGILGVVDPADGTNLAELTDYLIHYESGVDFLVWISDQSAAYPIIMVAY